ncbi:NrsF family protein [Paraburkholderia sp. GAS206C]|uniref:NrsF family protein n=1 Tax=unclassified Paraburkholderia TaxID=2615204 RepID=UPI003D20FCE6
MNSIGVAPVDRHALTKRFGAAVLVGATGALLTTAVVPGIRRDLAEVAATPIFWARIALPLCLMIGSLRMSTPSP